MYVKVINLAPSAVLAAALLLGGCGPAAPAPPPYENATIAGTHTRLALTLPFHAEFGAAELPISPDAAPFVTKIQRFATEKHFGVEAHVIAVAFQTDAITQRIGPPNAPARLRFHHDFGEHLLRATLASFPPANGATASSFDIQVKNIRGVECSVAAMQYTSSFGTPARLTAVLVPNEQETWLIVLPHNEGEPGLPDVVAHIVASLEVKG